MDVFDQRVREAVRQSLADHKVPPAPEFALAPTPVHPATTKRWLVAAAAAILVVGIATAGRTAFAQIVVAVAHMVRFFEVDTRGQIESVQSRSLTLAEALRLQEFQVVPPAGIPPGGTLSSIERLGVGSSTTLIFTYDYGGTTFTIIEAPANARETPNLGYSARPGPGGPIHGGLAPRPQKIFHVEATVWVSGTTHISLFAANVLSPDQVRMIENAMSHTPRGPTRGVVRRSD